jgi:hypothetical protein
VLAGSNGIKALSNRRCTVVTYAPSKIGLVSLYIFYNSAEAVQESPKYATPVALLVLKFLNALADCSAAVDAVAGKDKDVTLVFTIVGAVRFGTAK